MLERIEEGFMVFFAEGEEGIGAVRAVSGTGLIVYVENAGEFLVPAAAITAVHDTKVILSRAKVDPALLEALRHVHEREDPRLTG